MTKILVKPGFLSDSTPGILVGFYTSSTCYIAMKIHQNAQVTFSEHVDQISKLLCGGASIVGIYSDIKLDDKVILLKMEQISGKDPKVYIDKKCCKLFKKSLENVDFIEQEMKLKAITTNISVDVSFPKDLKNRDEFIKNGFMHHLDLFDRSEFKITDSHCEVFYPTKNSDFKPIKQGDKEVHICAEISSVVLGLEESISEIQKDLKKCLLEQLKSFQSGNTLVKRLFFQIGGLTWSDYNNISFGEAKQKFKEVLNLELDPADEWQYKIQAPISPKGREKKKVVEDDDLPSNSKLMEIKKEKLKKVQDHDDLPSNSSIMSKSRNAIHSTIDDLHEDILVSNSTLVSSGNYHGVIEDITNEMESNLPSNSEIIKKNVKETVRQVVDEDIPSNSELLLKGIRQAIEQVDDSIHEKLSETLPSNSTIIKSTKTNVEKLESRSSALIFISVAVLVVIIAIFKIL